jgi:hypothetical protein
LNQQQQQPNLAKLDNELKIQDSGNSHNIQEGSFRILQENPYLVHGVVKINSTNLTKRDKKNSTPETNLMSKTFQVNYINEISYAG